MNGYDVINRVGKWVVYICEDSGSRDLGYEHSGYFEHDSYGEGGRLWFYKWELVDYDGIEELPEQVEEAIKQLDFSLGEE